MGTFSLVACIVTAAFCAVHLLRPVSRAEKAYLVHIAEGDSKSEAIVDGLVAKKWLPWTRYDSAKQFVKRRREHREVDGMLARSAARKAVSDARRK
ncbi:hypothetical protein [Cupriavidus sp. TMH.W2]|uniref:hypothetical protein n=1 Tax=Cupriavidus sp. TMH.W2 TaxID=3434465 RepID=UPI003D77518C